MWEQMGLDPECPVPGLPSGRHGRLTCADFGMTRIRFSPALPACCRPVASSGGGSLRYGRHTGGSGVPGGRYRHAGSAGLVDLR
jgi:hypothetical protein